jgi:hypothetical protein
MGLLFITNYNPTIRVQNQLNMATINFGGVEEQVVTREEFPLEKAREVLANETIAVIGYGVKYAR